MGEKKVYTIKFTFIGLILTIIGGFLSLLWMFILGILVGRTIIYPKDVAPPLIAIDSSVEKETKTIKEAKPKILEPAKKIPGKNYVLQMGSFKNRINAEDLHKKLIEKGYQNYIKALNLPKKGLVYRVYVGPYTLNQALDVYVKLTSYHPSRPLALSE